MSPELRKFRNTMAIMANLDKDELVDAGVIHRDAVGGSDWSRFNRDPIMFVLKATDQSLAALWTLIEKHQPADLKEKEPAA